MFPFLARWIKCSSNNLIKKEIKMKKSKVPKIKRLIQIMRSKFYPIIRRYESPYLRREIISLLDLIIFSVLCMIYFSGVYKRGYEILIDTFELFPKIRYNKLVERINRYESLLFKIQKTFLNKNCLLFIDTIPIETKQIIRKNRHEKIGYSEIIKKGVQLDTILQKNAGILDIKLPLLQTGLTCIYCILHLPISMI